jgi:hypothetical protein
LYQRLFEDWIGIVQTWGEQVAHAARGPDEWSKVRQALQSDSRIIPLFLLLGQAYARCTMSGLRYGGRLTETLIRRQSQVLARLQTIDSSSAHEQGMILRELADDARAFLREISELSLHEAQVLREELARADMAIQALASDGPKPRQEHARRWKAKP